MWLCLCIDVIAKDFERAKQLFVGAVDTVLMMANKISLQANSQSNPSSPASSLLGASCSGDSSHSSVLGATASLTVRGNGEGTRIGLEEHRRLFSFVPSKSARNYKVKTPKAKRPKQGPPTWRKDCVCLRSSTAHLPPSTIECMKLASTGLRLKELTFENDGDQTDID